MPTTGGGGSTSPASETVAGIAEIATQAETNTGTDDARIVTPAKLANYSGLGTPDATETVKGKAELATQAETDSGTDDARIVTPAKLANYSGLATPDATETVKGKAEVATQTETNTGTDDARMVTPLKLAGRTATATQAGVVELATDSEAQTGTDTARAVTPANLTARSATETRTGVVELATDAETQTGTDTARAITPANLSARSATETRAGIAEIATQAETDAGTDDARIVTPAKLKATTTRRATGIFSGYRSANQSLPQSATTTILFDAEEFDPEGAFTTAAGASQGRYTTTRVGYYRFNAGVLLSGATNAAQFFIVLAKNGTVYRRLDMKMSVNAIQVLASGSAVAKVDTIGDFFTITAYHDATGTVVAFGSPGITYFEGHYLGT